MFSIGDLELLTSLLYLWLVACVAWGRPRLAIFRGPSTPGDPVPETSFPRALEVLWLGSIAAVLLYPILAFFVPSTVLRGGLTVRFPGDEIAEAAGLVLVLVAGALVGWAFRALGRFAAVEIRLSPDHAIVRSGPYRWVRHPMYTANILLSSGFTLLFLSLPLLIPLGAIVGLALVRARVEERLFLGSARLTREYSEYRGETGRFLPVVRRRPRRIG